MVIHSSKKSVLSKVFRIIVRCMNFNDCLCSIYLTIIWAADIYFKDEFFLHEYQWRNSLACFTAFTFILGFTYFCQFILIFLSMVRLMIVVEPIDHALKHSGTVSKWIGSFSVSFLVISTATAMGKYPAGSDRHFSP